MKIEALTIENLYADGLHNHSEGVYHQKTLPCLSVCQAVHGSYEVEVGGSGFVSTGEGGVFVAGAGQPQKILHHDGGDGVMTAQWVFMDVIVDRFYRLEKLYRFPTVLPRCFDAAVGERLTRLRNSEKIGARYAAAYEIVDILLENAVLLQRPDPVMAQLERFIAEHYAERLGASDLAAELHCSVSQVFRFSQKYFQLSPANYINSIRLQNAAKLLESSGQQVKEIAFSSGFEDMAYFSHLFKRAFLVSPSEYRLRAGLVGSFPSGGGSCG